MGKTKSSSITGKGKIPKGKPKSGRVWKTEKTRFSSMKKDKPFNTTWAKKLTLRNELKLIKAQDKAIKDAKKQEIEDKKKRRAENLRRREENAKKSEVVQKIKNSAKLKRMSKKQLRLIQKR